jgi:glycosyltransferase involved in cell wall biosynthesis
MGRHKFSIVTVVLNSRSYIRQAVENVLGQGYDNFEHIVIDGGSTDGTVDVLREYPHLRWISEKDAGSVFALNKGLALMTGDVFGWLNSDESYLPGALATADTFLTEHLDWDMIYGTSIFVDKSGRTLGRNRLKPFNLRRQIAGFNTVGPPSAMFLRTGALRALGGRVDERWQHAYDHDLWIRVGARFTVRAVPVCFSTFGIHDRSGISTAPQHAEREAKLIRRFYGGERGIVGRFFWAPYRDAYVSVYRRLKWRSMTVRSRRPEGPAAAPAGAPGDYARNLGEYGSFWSQRWRRRHTYSHQSKLKRFRALAARAGLLGRQNLSVFDQGFGMGDMLFCFAGSSALCGTELSASAAASAAEEAARRGYRGVDFRVYSPGSAYPDEWAGRFDVVLSSHVLEHMSDVTGAIADLARLLKAGGTAFVVVPINERPGEDLNHFQVFTPEGIRGRLEAAGLEVVACEESDRLWHVISPTGYKLQRRRSVPLRCLSILENALFSPLPHWALRAVDGVLGAFNVPPRQCFVWCRKR